MSKDNFGDRMKHYEAQETERYFMPLLPVYARLDGRSFSGFTHGLQRPYDENMSQAMLHTTKYLVEKTHARIGYTQSDEISLVWKQDDYFQEIFFAGKIHKLCSVLASLTTVSFNQFCLSNDALWERAVKKLPVFDCRVFQLPNKTEAANAFLWREKDATKNAISMAARYYYSHKELQDKSSSEMQEMIFQKGQNFNDYPAFFKRGTFVRRILEERKLTEEERLKIPENCRPSAEQLVKRSRIAELEMPPFSKVTNRVGVIFDGEKPEVEKQLTVIKEGLVLGNSPGE